MTTEPESAREIIQMRAVAAPRALVWEAMTEARHADAWWGPLGFTNKTTSMDVRVGGEWLFDMSHAQHGIFPNRIVYIENTWIFQQRLPSAQCCSEISLKEAKIILI